MADSFSSLMPVAEALQQILPKALPCTQVIEVPLTGALGRVLAEAQIAMMDVPAYDNSAMDGFAVNTSDLRDDEPELTVSQSIAAGFVGQKLEPGTAARIFTGAPVPDGADAVVIQEDTRIDGNWVTVLKKPEPGRNIRRAGHDIEKGTDVLEAGHLLQPQDLGLLASLGMPTVRVRAPLTVAIINTGTEVVAPDRPLGPGQIHDSNSFVLEGLLYRLGCTVVRMGIVEDSLDSTLRVLQQAADVADCIITTGGVSVGDEDHVKEAVEKLGQLALWKLAIKPGKPFACGSIGETAFFGLPGNPVAVFVTFAVLVRPFLLKMQGAVNLSPPSYSVRAGFDVPEAGSRQEYIRVRLASAENGEQQLVVFPDQGSSILTSLSWADGLAAVPSGKTVFCGDLLEYIPFRGLI